MEIFRERRNREDIMKNIGAEITKDKLLRQEMKMFSHEKWEKRQQDYRRIIERDCYGYKKAKV